MPLLNPLALLGLLFIPAVIAMYLLKLRRDEAVVPSTLLWTRLVADVEANAPWQRLRRSLLLLLQLLLVIALAFALLAEAMLVIVFARNWRVSWWEWHLLMLVAFVAIAVAFWGSPSVSNGFS